MSKYVVRQPIKDADRNIFGYEILFQVKDEGLYNNDYAVADSISNFLMQNNDKILNDRITFITFTPNLLFRNTPKIFQQKKLVIQIEDNVVVHPLAENLIQRYKKEGYELAVNDFQFASRYFSIMEYIDYIKINFKEAGGASVANLVKMAKGFHKRCIASGVDTEELYRLAMDCEVDYYQGSYVAEVMTTKANKTEYLQSNFFQLVVAVTRDEPDMDEIEEIVSRDASLSYAILKMVNSVYFALRRRTSSIKQALVILGIGQLKQWVYLLSFKQDEGGSSEELLKASFLRANFCSELLQYIEDMPISKSEAYLMGMFSTLGYLVDAPLEELLVEIPIADEIKAALVNHEGRCGMLYDLVLSYEKADWNNISNFAEQLGIPSNVIAQIYFDCVEYVNNIWESLTNPYKEQIPDDTKEIGIEEEYPVETVEMTSVADENDEEAYIDMNEIDAVQEEKPESFSKHIREKMGKKPDKK